MSKEGLIVCIIECMKRMYEATELCVCDIERRSIEPRVNTTS